jgi:geranylgeranyl diphosphate synthase type I
MFSSQVHPSDLYTASTHLINAGGKRFRPFLVIKSCELVGGKREKALQIAAAIEFIHNFTLIHDDIMDRDEKRRGVPSVHVRWGIPIALLSGDLLFAKAYETIINHAKTHQTPIRRTLKIIDFITQATISLCEGQALDMLFESKFEVSEREYIRMISKKTAALMEAAAKSGAVIGGGNYHQVEKLGKFAFYIGLGFQIIDDVLGLTAEEHVLGKPIGSDLREGKRTLILIHAFSQANKTQRKQILSILGDNNASPNQINIIINLIQKLGSIEYATRKAEKYIEKAKTQLSIFPSSRDKEVLSDLCNYIIKRKY